MSYWRIPIDVAKVTVGHSIELGKANEQGYYDGPTLEDMVGVDEAKRAVRLWSRHRLHHLYCASLQHYLAPWLSLCCHGLRWFIM